jgi:Zn-dependent protease with chaperone function
MRATPHFAKSRECVKKRLLTAEMPDAYTAPPMMAALARLGSLAPGGLPQSLRTFGITDMPAWMGLFASHPPIEARIAALRDADAIVMAR